MSASERFEALAHEFFTATGMMAPGKDSPMAFGNSPSYEDRIAAWNDWLRTRPALTPSETAGPPSEPFVWGEFIVADVLAMQAREKRWESVARRLRELAPQVAPETSGHDGFRFTLGFDLQADRDAAAQALSLVEHTRWEELVSDTAPVPSPVSPSPAVGPTREPISTEQTEAWKRMSWGHYNAPVARMLAEIDRLRAALDDVRGNQEARR